jgi:glucosamine--fructose-6-phosphate aminotransferase (isomerizing)
MGVILGIVSQTDIVTELVETMGRIPCGLEDVCGLATLSVSTMEVQKDIGPWQQAWERFKFNNNKGRIGIAHVGELLEGNKISRKNAQPHLSCDERFAIVTDGVISNSRRLRANLATSSRHFFFSDTGCEIFGHLMEEAYRDSHSVEEAFVRSVRQIEGNFALAVISNYESPRIFCAQKNRSLFIETDGQKTFMSSELKVFQFGANRHRLGEREYAVLSGGAFTVVSISRCDEEEFGSNGLLLDD